jgi:hypothetical protein
MMTAHQGIAHLSGKEDLPTSGLPEPTDLQTEAPYDGGFSIISGAEVAYGLVMAARQWLNHQDPLASDKQRGLSIAAL